MLDYVTTLLPAIEHLSPQVRATLSRYSLIKRAADFSSCGITIADIDAPDMPLIYINPAFTTITGYPIDEVIGRNCRFLQGELRAQPELDRLRAAMRAQEPVTVVMRNFRKDGQPFWNELHVAPLFDDGRMTHLIGIQTDVTARVDAEHRRDQLLLELQKANQELNDFAYVVSHDLRAPLRAIGSLANWLLTDYGDQLGEEGSELVRLINQRTRRLDELSNGVLQYSRVGRERERVDAINLVELLPEVVELLAPPPHLKVVVAPGFPTISAEPTRIYQVFHNLIGNAIKYHDKPAGTIAVEWAREGDFWRFSVRDDGPGIEAKYFHKIFQIFQTLHARDDVESSGIGLSIVKKIVELQGGTVGVDSELGKGTTFSFTWPRTILGAIEVSNGK